MRVQLSGFTIGLLCACMAWPAITGKLSAQSRPYSKKSVPQTDLQLLYAFYDQDGIHSAVTGGAGTEDLNVHSPRISVNILWDSLQSFSFYGGTDMITSASTDRIDFNVSSASRRDFRVYGTADFGRRLGKRNWWGGLNYSFSGESDYTSHGLGAWLSWDSPGRNRRLYASFRAYFDDLRWGHLYWKREYLIYPEELRQTEWFDIHKRYTWHFSLSYFQVINRRMNLAFFPDLVVQNGLLSTPFHRVYFRDSEEPRVENLPRQRLKVPVGIRWNWFAGKRTIFRTFYRFYWDNFGIRSHTLELETPVKVSPNFSLIPTGRLYTQSAARFFAPFGEHWLSQAYYTSDYDLSAFSAWQLGMGIRWAMARKLFSGPFKLKAVELRYAYYQRSDGLWANWLSFLIDISKG